MMEPLHQRQNGSNILELKMHYVFSSIKKSYIYSLTKLFGQLIFEQGGIQIVLDYVLKEKKKEKNTIRPLSYSSVRTR